MIELKTRLPICPMPETDPELPTSPSLCERLKAGSASALADLLRSSYPSVAGTLRRDFGTVFNAQDRDEMVTEAGLRLWEARARLDCSVPSLQPYLIRCARNLALDRLRRQQIPTRSSVEDVADSQPDRAEQESSQMEALRVVLDSLDDDERRIVLTHARLKESGAWTKDLSQELGITANALRAKRVRVTKKIRDRLRVLGYRIATDEGEDK